MTKANNYPIILLMKFVLIIVFTNIYYNFYKDTTVSFQQKNSEVRAAADSAETNLRLQSDSKISSSYKEYLDKLKVQKSVVDNLYNKLKNTNADNLPKLILDRPEYKAVAYTKPLNSSMYYGDTVAVIKDLYGATYSSVILRETRQTFLLDYNYKKVSIHDLAKALDRTRLAIDYDRDLCNRVIKNANNDIAFRRNVLNSTRHKIDASLGDFIIFTATIEFTFNYTDIIPSSSKLSLLCLIHKILAGFLYFILINQLKKKFFP